MKRVLGIGAAVLLLILLAWLLRGVVYQLLLVPIQYVSYITKVLYLALPHELIWGALVIVVYFIAVNSLYQRPNPLETTHPRLAHYAERRITQLARYLSNRKRPFYRHRIKHALTELALQVISQKKRITLQEARSLVNRKELDVPPVMQSYLKDGLLPWAYGPLQSSGIIQELLQRRRKEKEADNVTMQVLNYIEEQMEIESDGNSPGL